MFSAGTVPALSILSAPSVRLVRRVAVGEHRAVVIARNGLAFEAAENARKNSHPQLFAPQHQRFPAVFDLVFLRLHLVHEDGNYQLQNHKI